MTENEDSRSPDDSMRKNSESLRWEREVLEKLVLSAIDEQRKARRWGVFFKLFLVVYLAALLILSTAPFPGELFSKSKNHTAVVDVVGMISEGATTDAAQIIEGLNAAAKNAGTQGIILRMNTPGGSPVQSSYIYNEIRRIKQDNPEMPIYAVISDICASGGYFIASAADKIFVNPSSLVGSIGVLVNGFGFVDTLEKMGIERRLMVAGKRKGLFDPFSPVNNLEKEHIQGMLDEIHEQFIAAVRQGRGDRLASDPSIFSGLVWTGERSVQIGLADDFGTITSVAKDVIGEKNVVNFTPEEKLFDRLAGKFGAALENVIATMTFGLTSRIQ